MKIIRRFAAFLLAAALICGLSACGEEKNGIKTIAEIGEKQYGVVYRLDDKLAPQIEAAMKDLAASGVLSALSIKWLGSDRICLSGDAEAISKLEEAPTSRAIRVGVQSDFVSMSSPVDGEYAGMSVDIAKYIGTLYGWEVRIQPIGADELGTQLSSGNIDCALGFGIETVNPEKYTVGNCYMKSKIVVASPESSKVSSLRGLKDQRVGSVSDPSLLGAANDSSKLMKYAEAITKYLSPQRCINALHNGWCAAVVLDEIMMNSYR